MRKTTTISRGGAAALALAMLVVLVGCEGPAGMVPAQKVADDFGLVVRYDKSADTVTLTGGGHTVVATTGSDLMTVDGRMESLGRFVTYNGAEVFFPASVYAVLERRVGR